MTETLARALWDVVPYDRVMPWEEASAEVQEHYKARARQLLTQFDITAKRKVVVNKRKQCGRSPIDETKVDNIA